ncbi:MAG: ABC transporter ATP-binding protein [Flavobacteriales bacterium]|nr:ABC transporter ATP-binding protein [Flavobacteriales bacterium]MBT4704108.1 ABC transporter ATP-binding protein [Flavobacteriales bacterium]MBT4930755.1 ABC transporter ATP-binding protein [Flavobacteriales bacterium]MBT5132088.1 ABC transporter ATP-binding protein [Flavobacteriales bacterium]MBT6133354.1 ABC transporter ATP-binding protein [Flavobacteriales bacterium]
MIEASGVTKKYGTLEVLKGIDLEISASEIVSIVGASGAGKTTLLQILGTLDQPDAGEVVINGTNVFNLKDKDVSDFRNRSIGFVFQFHQLLPEFTAIENVCLPAFIKGLTRKEAEAKAKKLLQFLNVENRANHKPNQLSGGEQQRVAVARSLINEPKVVFADEPSGNLDTKNASELHKLFFDLRDELGQTFVIVTHNEELAELADRKLTIADGRIQS